MAFLIPFCLWFACPQPAPIADVAPVRTVSAPVAPDTTVKVSPPGDVEQWRSLVTAYFPASEVERALCILWHESRGVPTALNKSSGAAGLFQFIPSTWDNMVPASISGGSYSSGAPFIPEVNVAAAAWLQSAEGWTQWSPYKAGKCR